MSKRAEAMPIHLRALWLTERRNSSFLEHLARQDKQLLLRLPPVSRATNAAIQNGGVKRYRGPGLLGILRGYLLPDLVLFGSATIQSLQLEFPALD